MMRADFFTGHNNDKGALNISGVGDQLILLQKKILADKGQFFHVML
jgi:hypothetical protein